MSDTKHLMTDQERAVLLEVSETIKLFAESKTAHRFYLDLVVQNACFRLADVETSFYQRNDRVGRGSDRQKIWHECRAKMMDYTLGEVTA